MNFHAVLIIVSNDVLFGEPSEVEDCIEESPTPQAGSSAAWTPFPAFPCLFEIEAFGLRPTAPSHKMSSGAPFVAVRGAVTNRLAGKP